MKIYNSDIQRRYAIKTCRKKHARKICHTSLSLLFSFLLFSCLVLSFPCLILSRLALSCLALSLSYLVLSRFVCYLCRLGGRMGSFFVVSGVFWGYFWSSWGSFEALGVVLGRPWEVLEALEAVLERVDAPGGVALDLTAALGSVFGPILGVKRGPRRSPKRPKIHQKIILKNDRFLDRS